MARRLRIYYDEDHDSLDQATRRTQAAITRLSGHDLSKLRSSTARASDDLSGKSRALAGRLAGVAGAALSGAAAYLSFSQAKDAVNATEGLAKATRSLNENLGLSTKEASQWAATAYVRGVDSKKLGMAFKTLSAQITAARDGSASAVESFTKLGFTEREIERGANDTSFLMGAVADGLHEMRDDSDKAAVSGRLFGRGWQSVAPILRDGRKQMEETLAIANEYGATFDNKALDSISDLIGAQRELQMVQLGLKVQFTENLAPTLIDIALEVARFAKRTMNGKGAGDALVEVLKGLWAVTVVFWKAVRDILVFESGVVSVIHALTRGVGPLKPIFTVSRTIVNLFFNPIARLKLVAPAIRTVTRIGKGVGDGISAGFRAAGNVFDRIASAIARIVEKLLDALGIAEIKMPVIGVKLPKGPRQFGGARTGFQRGGYVQRLAKGGNVVSQAAAEANRIDKLHSSYVWGGGHVTPSPAGGPWDCSSAVSRVLQAVGYDLPTMVSGQLASWGAPGPGAITIYANPGHVLMSIAGRFWGTSGENPGGGPGWISPRPQGYLAAFTQRHPAGMPTGAGAALAMIGKIHVTGRGPLAGMAQSVANRMRRSANRYLSQLGGAGQPLAEGHIPGTLSEGQFLAIANEARRQTGHMEFSAQGLLTLARQESGLQVDPPPPADINTQQGNPSRGLMQVTESNFRAYHEPGTSRNPADPLANICASINYQVARYGRQVTFSPYMEGGPVGDWFVAADGFAEPQEVPEELLEQLAERAEHLRALGAPRDPLSNVVTAAMLGLS